MKSLPIVLFAAAVAGMGGVAYYWARTAHTPPGQPPLVEIQAATLAGLEADFNKTAGQRIVLLLSPT